MRSIRKFTYLITASAISLSALIPGLSPAGSAEAAESSYPIQELRFGIGDTNRSFSISDTADGSYICSLGELEAGTDKAKWSLNYISSGVYEIVSSATGYVLTNQGGLAVLAPDTDGSNQRWQITPVEQDSEGYDLYYKIVSNADTNAALTFNADSNSISVDTYSGDIYQKYRLNLDGLQGYASNCMVDGQEKAGTIGGLLGETVFVDTDDELKAAMLREEPLTIVLTKDLDWHPYGQQEIRSHKTLVGAYGVTLKDAQLRTAPNDTNSSTPPSDNLVFRNLTFLAKDSTNCMLFNIYSSRQIWIDHCSFVSELPRSVDEVGKFIWCNSPFDGTWKSRATDFMTISYCSFYNRYWTTLFASVSYEVPDNEKIRCRVSFLYCFYDQCVRRCPQLGSAYGHIVSSFWRGKSASETDGIDQIIGGGQTDVVSQNCRFEAIASGHEICAGGGPEPYRDDGSYTAPDANSTPTAISFSPQVISTRHPETENYGYSLIDAVGTYNTKDFCLKYSGAAGSADALCYITDDALAEWVSQRYPCPFHKDLETGDSPIAGQGAVMDTDHVYSFINAGSGHYLEVADSIAAKGTNVQQGNTGENRWNLAEAGDGYYYIYSVLDDGKTYCLDLAYGDPANNTNIGIWTNTEDDSKKFKFIDNGDGTYTIVTKSSSDKSCIGIQSGSAEAGANAVQWEKDGSDNQKWIAAINGERIRHMQVTDSTRSSWRIDTSAAVGDLVYGDRDNANYETLPEAILGAELIVTACDAKNSTEGNLASFVAGADMTVYVALDNRVTTVPAWLSSWTKTDMTVTSNRTVTYNLYSLACKAGDTVTLGTNGQSGGCVNYTVFAAITEEKPAVIQGDVNADGAFSMMDIVMMQKYLLNMNSLTDIQAGDVNADSHINVFDLALMKKELLDQK
ncbi:MAG: RICIN domain-containing protein [Ruminococcus sp.]|nr:RICIN domain-containing protein [Ruminococcus sp.]